MNLKSTLLVTMVACSLAVNAQDATIKDLQDGSSKAVKSIEKDGWKRGGTLAINLNQGSLSNWAAGGEQNTLGINGLFNYGVNYRKGKVTWDNFFDIALGFQNATSFSQYRKTDDRIDITSKLGRQLSKKWYAAVLANFNSQALKGYNYGNNTKISNFLAPGKLLISPGLDYRPNDNFSFFISPITARWVFKNDADFLAQNKFGVAASKKNNSEMGAFATLKYKQALSKFATYTGRLDAFSNYKRKPENVDIFMTNLLAMKFNKWLGANVSLDVIYDDDVIKKTQLKEILGIGLTVNL